MLSDVGTYLDTNVVGGVTLALGTNLFLGRMMESPDIAVALYEPVSSPPTFHYGGTGVADLESPRLQVHVRHTAYSTGKSVAFDVWEDLCQVANQTLTSTLYLRIQALDSPTFLMRDENDRVLFTMNFEALKVPSA